MQQSQGADSSHPCTFSHTQRPPPFCCWLAASQEVAVGLGLTTEPPSIFF